MAFHLKFQNDIFPEWQNIRPYASKEKRVVFSSVELPAYQHQWYIKKGAYYFTASEWSGSSGIPNEKKGVAYFYDFQSHKITEKKITKQEVEDSKPVMYEFDPRNCEDCVATHNNSVQWTRFPRH